MERTAREESAAQRDFGDETTLQMMRALATAKKMAELSTGKSAYEDPETAQVAHEAMIRVLDALFAVRPTGQADKTDPADGQDQLILNPDARTLGQNVGDVILEGIGPVLKRTSSK